MVIYCIKTDKVHTHGLSTVLGVELSQQGSLRSTPYGLAGFISRCHLLQKCVLSEQSLHESGLERFPSTAAHILTLVVQFDHWLQPFLIVDGLAILSALYLPVRKELRVDVDRLQGEHNGKNVQSDSGYFYIIFGSSNGSGGDGGDDVEDNNDHDDHDDNDDDVSRCVLKWRATVECRSQGIGSGIPGTVEERVFQERERSPPSVEAGVARREKFTVLPFAAAGRQLFFISSKNLTVCYILRAATDDFPDCPKSFTRLASDHRTSDSSALLPPNDVECFLRLKRKSSKTLKIDDDDVIIM
ncbi:hypothetical protein QTP88_016454 [Uroleucon formosanum]